MFAHVHSRVFAALGYAHNLSSGACPEAASTSSLTRCPSRSYDGLMEPLADEPGLGPQANLAWIASRSSTTPTELWRSSHDDVTQAPRLEWLRRMWEIRLFEDKVQELFMEGKVEGTTHLCQGQEAVPVGPWLRWARMTISPSLIAAMVRRSRAGSPWRRASRS